MVELLHDIIDRSAERGPQRTAFRYDGQSLNYSDLVQRANGFAGLLDGHGVVAGDRVGLLLPKSLEMPVAVFGTLKAGAVVVPLDAQSPPDRLSAIIADAGIRCLVGQPDQARLLADLSNRISDSSVVIGASNGEIPNVTALPWSAVEPSQAGPRLAISGQDPAYILFTSGSTGQPKGILHSHDSALAYARLAADMYEVGPDDVLGNFAPLHFDQSTFEFYSGPLRGAATVLIPPAYGIAVASLAELIEEEALTFWYSVPSVLVRLVQSGALAGRNLSHLRWILFGGEVFPPSQLGRLMALLPNAEFSNVYGPTEVNQCTCFNFGGNDEVPDPLPIGRPWNETRALVIDEKDQPVRPGETGELLIHSSTMMLGYWGRPDLNEAAFYVPEDDNSDVRYYRTGDLVRAGDDGNLVFLGRKDRQIKSRGYRVELDEVESVLGRVDGVAEAVTYTISDEAGTLLIDAAVRLREGCVADERQIALHAARELPAYARPRRIWILDDIPRTRTGKVDRSRIAELTGRL